MEETAVVEQDEVVETASLPERGPKSKSIRERVRDSDDVLFEDVPMPEWDDVTLRIFSMSGSERADFLAPFASGDPENETEDELRARLKEMTPALLLMTAFDPETGKHPLPEYRIFEEGDLGWLAEKGSSLLERAGKVALRLSGMDKDAKERAGKD